MEVGEAAIDVWSIYRERRSWCKKAERENQYGWVRCSRRVASEGRAKKLRSVGGEII
jgi:hypothetical protein